MNRTIFILIAAVGFALAGTRAQAQTGPAAMQGPTTVQTRNPYASAVTTFAQELQRQYASIRFHMTYYPRDTAGLQYLCARYMADYRRYWEYVNAYQQWERQNPQRPPIPGQPPIAGAGRIVGRVVVAGAGSTPVRPTQNPGQLVQGRRLQVSFRNAGRGVIRSAAELRNQIQSTGAPGRPAPIPQVDFNREMVVFAAMGLRGTDHSIQITELRRTSTGLVAYVSERRPPAGAPNNSAASWPTSAVVVPRVNLNVTFQDAASSAVPPVAPGMTGLPGATVSAFRQTQNGQVTGWVNAGSARTDAQGAFQLSNLPAGSYVIRVSRQGFRTQDVRVNAAATAQPVTVQMQRDTTTVVPPRRRNAPEVIAATAPAAAPGPGPSGPGDNSGTPAPAQPLTLLGMNMR